MCSVGETFGNKNFYGFSEQPELYSTDLNNEPYFKYLMLGCAHQIKLVLSQSGIYFTVKRDPEYKKFGIPLF